MECVPGTFRTCGSAALLRKAMHASASFYLVNLKGPFVSKSQREMIKANVAFAHVEEGLVGKVSVGEGAVAIVNTLQAAEPPYKVSNGHIKIIFESFYLSDTQVSTFVRGCQ